MTLPEFYQQIFRRLRHQFGGGGSMGKTSRVYDNADVGCDAARLLDALPEWVQPSCAQSGTCVRRRLQ
jgi:hypothetical protein